MSGTLGCYDVRPLIDYVQRKSECTLLEVAETLDLSYRQVMRHVNQGQLVHQWQADRLAVRAGLHPAEVWEQW